MAVRLRIQPIVVALTTAAIGSFVWVVVFGWPPIFRNAADSELLADFKSAAIVPKIAGRDQDAKWDFPVALGGGVVAHVRGRDHMDVISIAYSDEANPRALYEYRDYSNPQEVRRSANILYVHWAVSLIRDDHWILAYDLEGRRQLARHRVDPADVPAPNPVAVASTTLGHTEQAAAELRSVKTFWLSKVSRSLGREAEPNTRQ